MILKKNDLPTAEDKDRRCTKFKIVCKREKIECVARTKRIGRERISARATTSNRGSYLKKVKGAKHAK